jgi:hypothetical protein
METETEVRKKNSGSGDPEEKALAILAFSQNRSGPEKQASTHHATAMREAGGRGGPRNHEEEKATRLT